MSFPLVNTTYNLDQKVETKHQSSYVPLFKHLSLSSATNLSIHSTGGIVATTDNVAGTGYCHLNKTIKKENSWRIAFKFIIGDARSTSINLTDTSNNFWKASKVTFSTSGISVDVGGVNAFNSIGGPSITPGTTLWFTIASDGVKVTTALFHENATSVTKAPSYQDSINKLCVKTVDITLQYTAINVFDNLSRIYISNASTQNRVLGYYFIEGSLDGPDDDLFNPPFVLEPSFLNERYAWIIGTGKINATKEKNLVFVHHPNGNPGDIANQPYAFITLMELLKNGYSVCGMSGLHGVHGAYDEATSSNWGSPTGLYYRSYFINLISQFIPNVTKLYHLGLSMGFLNAFNYCCNHKGLTKAIIGISAVTDLSDSFTNRGFSTPIKKGFGKWYVCIQNGTGQTPASSPTYWTAINNEVDSPESTYFTTPYVWRDAYNAGTAYVVNDIVCVASTGTVGAFYSFDPKLNTDKVTTIPFLFLHGDSDTTIPSSQITTFNNNTLVSNGKSSTFIIPGGTHLGSSVYNTEKIITFFNTYS
jgi:pimeloyl-ACP methyl ester carboxylesterase